MARIEWTKEHRRKVVEAERAACGLPPTVQDPATLAALADLRVAARRSRKTKAAS